ncbi:LOW QUALITY PROTEIN: ras-associating and dilute domain-containing protein-like [Rhinoraja longicauda]
MPRSNSAAEELCSHAVLLRFAEYSLDKGSAGDYVLCDVIGRLDEDHQWKTECFRAVGECEKPLILQSLWKPKEGFVRRFEIRRKMDVEEITAQEKDTVTAGINAQARRLQMTRTRASSAVTDEDIESSFALWRSVSELNLSLKARERAGSGRSQRTEAGEPGYDHVPAVGSEREETESSDHSATQRSIHPPHDFPYLLMLHGYSPTQDLLVHVLCGASQVFGRGADVEGVKVDVALWAPDIQAWQCRVRRQEVASGGVVTLLRPGKGAAVTHNGLPIQREKALQPGDLVGLGAHYLFMYKDPTLGSATHSQRPPWFPSPLCQRGPAGELQCRLCGCPVRAGDGGDTSPGARPRLRDPRGHDYQLQYSLPQEEALIRFIINSPHTDCTDFKLAPAFLLSLCIQHSATAFQPADLRHLLLAMASHIQTGMWEKTKELAALHRDHASASASGVASAGEDGEGTVSVGMAELIPGLQPLVYWMANAIELLHFVQQEVPQLLAWEQHVDLSGCQSEQLLSTKLASEEAMTVLEEVIMFTFQQSVYYLTKVCCATWITSFAGELTPQAVSETQQGTDIRTDNGSRLTQTLCETVWREVIRGGRQLLEEKNSVKMYRPGSREGFATYKACNAQPKLEQWERFMRLPGNQNKSKYEQRFMTVSPSQ